MCTNPLRGWLVFGDYVNKVTKSNVLAVRYDRFQGKILSIYKEEEITDSCCTRYIDIPCRSCLECYNQSRREWIARAVAEAQCHDNMIFVTFTYDDDQIPKVEYITEDGEILVHNTLHYPDFQKFMKRFRKAIGKPVRYLVCGEYGLHTQRPHYHAVLYGISLDDLGDAFPHSKSKTGDCLYESKFLDSVWKKGYTLSANANVSTMAYVAGYVAKKADTLEGKFFYDYFGIDRPFIRGSLRPALGSRWLFENIDRYDSIYDYCSVSTADDPVKIYLTSNWKQKYKKKVLKGASLDDICDYEEELVARRVMLLDDRFQLLDTDMSKDDYNNSLNDNLRNSSKRKRGVY